jgi:hypothetical protein
MIERRDTRFIIEDTIFGQSAIAQSEKTQIQIFKGDG